MYLLIRWVIALTVVIIEVHHSYQQHTKLSPNIFLSELLNVQMQLLGITTVDFDITEQLMIIYSESVE